MGCVNPAVDNAISRTDHVLEQRLVQVERMASNLKTETIDESKQAAVLVVDKAMEGLEETGKEVVSHAAKEMAVVAEDVVKQTGEILKEQQKTATDDLRKIIKEDLADAVEAAVIQSADKLAERFGAVKQAVPGPDGVPIEVWALGGSGLLAGAWQVIRNLMNSSGGKKRFTETEIEMITQKRIEKNGFSCTACSREA